MGPWLTAMFGSHSHNNSASVQRSHDPPLLPYLIIAEVQPDFQMSMVRSLSTHPFTPRPK